LFFLILSLHHLRIKQLNEAARFFNSWSKTVYTHNVLTSNDECVREYE